MPDLLHACELINCSRLPVLILVWLHLAQCLTAATAQQCSSTILMEGQADNDNPPIQGGDENCGSANTNTAATPHHDCPDCASSGTASCAQGASSSFMSSSLMSRRPYFRTALARSVYSKILVDREFRQFDKTKVRICSHVEEYSNSTTTQQLLSHSPLPPPAVAAATEALIARAKLLDCELKI